jgi:hypothetical protein
MTMSSGRNTISVFLQMVFLFIWRAFGCVVCLAIGGGKLNSFQEQVQTNKDLDLPTQQELLAQFRCDEIASVALEEFNAQAKSQRKPVEAGRVVEGLGALMARWVDATFGKSYFP